MTLKLNCVACGKEGETERGFFPPGWTTFGYRRFCPTHVLELKVDGHMFIIVKDGDSPVMEPDFAKKA